MIFVLLKYAGPFDLKQSKSSVGVSRDLPCPPFS